MTTKVGNAAVLDPQAPQEAGLSAVVTDTGVVDDEIKHSVLPVCGRVLVLLLPCHCQYSMRAASALPPQENTWKIA